MMSEANFVHAEKPIRIESGDGIYLYDEQGSEYIDCGASYACTPLGHSHEGVRTAIREQLAEVTFVQASYPVKRRDDAYATLAAAAPGDLENIWLCNSGTEANEAALKFARSATGNSKIVATMQGFHGRTMGALSTTWTKAYREPFEPLIGDVEFIPYGDADALIEAVDSETAAVIFEPIQGEGGINIPSTDYLKAARDVTADADAALIIDEVQSGLGRTGTMWAVQQADIVPDMLTTAKGLANGLPAGATLCSEWIADGAGSHNATFSGGPVVSAAIESTVSTIVDEDWPSHAGRVGQELRETIDDRLGDRIRDVRGAGLMIGIEVTRDANRIARDLAMETNILVLTAGRTTIRLLPPLIFSESDADHVATALEGVIE